MFGDLTEIKHEELHIGKASGKGPWKFSFCSIQKQFF